MASPQLEKGYTRLANGIIYAMMKTKLSNYEARILWVVWRKTYGFSKKSDWIADSQYTEMTGIKKQHVWRTKKSLIDRSILKLLDSGKVAFNKDYDSWGKPCGRPVQIPVDGVTQRGIGSNPTGLLGVTQRGGHKRNKRNLTKDNGMNKKKEALKRAKEKEKKEGEKLEARKKLLAKQKKQLGV